MHPRNRYAELLHECEKVFSLYKQECDIPLDFMDPILIQNIMEFPVKLNGTEQRFELSSLIYYWDTIERPFCQLFDPKEAKNPLTRELIDSCELDEVLQHRIEDFIIATVKRANGLIKEYGGEKLIEDFISMERKDTDIAEKLRDMEKNRILRQKHLRLKSEMEESRKSICELLKKEGASEAEINLALKDINYESPLTEHLQLLGLFNGQAQLISCHQVSSRIKLQEEIELQKMLENRMENSIFSRGKGRLTAILEKVRSLVVVQKKKPEEKSMYSLD